MDNYDTVTGAPDNLVNKGYTLEFDLVLNKLVCAQNTECLNPSELKITETYRVEGDSNPADTDTVKKLTFHHR